MKEEKAGTSPWYSDRRRFLGRTATVATAMVASGMNLEFAPAKRNERFALAAADGGQEWNIASYRARLALAAGGEQRIVAELLSKHNEVIGQLEDLRIYDIPWFRGRSRPTRESTTLRWAAESLKSDIDMTTGSFSCTYNDQHIGTVVQTVGTVDPALLQFVKDHQELFKMAYVVQRDVLRVFAPQLRANRQPLFRITTSTVHADCYPNCPPSGVECEGEEESGYGFAWTRSTAEQKAEDDVNENCSNWVCWGCCSGSVTVDCACTEGDFACGCYATGDTCTCDCFLC